MLEQLLDPLLGAFERRTSSPSLVRGAARMLSRTIYAPGGAAVIQRLQERRLRRTVCWAARRAGFYRAAFQRAGVDPSLIRSADDLSALPFTTAADLRAWRGLACVPEERLTTVFTTSGTTGEPKRVYFTHHDLQALVNSEAVAVRYARPGRLVALIALPTAHGLWAGSAMAQRAVERAGGLPLPVGIGDPHETLRWMRLFEPDSLASSVSYLRALTRAAEEEGYRPRLGAILLGGEMLTPELREAFTAYWRAPVYDSYGSTEMGAGVAASLPGCMAYHLADPHLLTEIVDPVSGRPAQEGELVFTTLMREGMPLIRYRMGDRARWVEHTCPISLRTVQLLGRVDDLVVVGDMNLYAAVMARAVQDVPGASGRIQVHLETTPTGDRLGIRVEGPAQDAAVRGALFAAYPELPAHLASGLLELTVEPGVTLGDQAKAYRIVDRRGNAAWITGDPAPAESRS